ncbi:hypothetical protein L226DRAFT_572881 [Lentinus tigrinus ALCF2SS1-7]|uniref:C2H2-type domain-containing protein n=1 Tax=Lentinus tigrinus ALCF2SS1-6 TaxID=1328759 RepID=A0A5C2S4R1_9APHY|nr:hypothetical protein L227DRAFT_181264 [Lentinus tigrinus ALCF2SS1-6]RPD72772.1 hypothetical protein L226DRAFT_572881 [Lentinus tigrinus ALCF2SS1-7]
MFCMSDFYFVEDPVRERSPGSSTEESDTEGPSQPQPQVDTGRKRARTSPSSSAESDAPEKRPPKKLPRVRLIVHPPAPAPVPVPALVSVSVPAPIPTLPSTSEILAPMSTNAVTSSKRRTGRKRGQANAASHRDASVPAPPQPTSDSENGGDFTQDDMRELRIIEPGAKGSDVCGIDDCTDKFPVDARGKVFKEHVRKHYPCKTTKYKCRRKGCSEKKLKIPEEQIRHMAREHLHWNYQCPDVRCGKVYKRWDTLVCRHWHVHAGREGHMTLEQIRAWIEQRKDARRRAEQQAQVAHAAPEEPPALPMDVQRETVANSHEDVEPEHEPGNFPASDSSDEYDADGDDDWESD